MVWLQKVWIGVGVAGLACLSGCGSDSGEQTDPTTDPIEIAGTWASDFGETETISSETWVTPFDELTVVEFDNENNVVILRNPPNAEFYPSAYSRVVWTEISGSSFFYCTIDFGKNTVAEAKFSTLVADDSDPAAGGCEDFPWTQLSLASSI